MLASEVPVPGHLEGRTLPLPPLSAASAAASAAPDDSNTKLTSSSAGTPAAKSKLFAAYEKGAEYFTNLFPVWLTICSLLALKDPSMFEWFTTE